MTDWNSSHERVPEDRRPSARAGSNPDPGAVYVENAVMFTICQVCRAEAVLNLIDAGSHPVSNRFLLTQYAHEDRFPLAVGQCQVCGLIQLTKRMAVDALVPRFDWVSYNEPEGHLDYLADLIINLPGIGAAPIVGAITSKDDSTLARLRDRGVRQTWRLDVADLGGPSFAGVETLQYRLTPNAVGQMRDKYPVVDILLVRHILEHTYDTHTFAAALREYVRPGGYFVFEVPDCAQAIEKLDYTRIWEEHILYFTSVTFRNTLRYLGFDVRRFDCFPYPSENSLVGIVQDRRQRNSVASENIELECVRGNSFAGAFPHRRSSVQEFLRQRRRGGSRTAIFGAGHLAAMFINLMDVCDAIEFVVEDHPRKQGLFLPGSRLPIKESRCLMDENIDLCLSSLSPESEERVIARQQDFIARGGVFASIFPSSPRALALISAGRM